VRREGVTDRRNASKDSSSVVKSVWASPIERQSKHGRTKLNVFMVKQQGDEGNNKIFKK
jgi:hypothetical protein